MRASEGLARLILDRVCDTEAARDLTDFDEPMCEILLGRRLEPSTRLLSPQLRELPPFRPVSLVPYDSVLWPISVESPRSCRATVSGSTVRVEVVSPSKDRHSGSWSIW